MSTHLAIDIGGSHGRAVLGECRDGRWSVTEVGTFSTRSIRQNGVLCWGVFEMFSGIRSLMERAATLVPRLDTVAIDTMGLAFVLLDAEGALVTPAVYTRVPQEEELRRQILSHFGEAALYSITGLEQGKLNSLYFLAAMKKQQPRLLADTRHFLMLPDYLNYLLTGAIHNEYTAATTSNLWDIAHMCWSEEIMAYTGICKEAFGPISHCGQIVGCLKREIASLPALKETIVVHAASHDTASACYSFRAEQPQPAFISAGTWGMLGCVLDGPILTEAARMQGFANEGAGGGQIKFLNNAPCMSVLEACAKKWYPNEPIPWNSLYSGLDDCSTFGSAIDLYHPYFRQQEDMPRMIQQYCREYGLPVPQTQKDIVGLVVHSIASHFGTTYKALKELTNHDFRRVVLIGGAARSPVFAKFCARHIEAEIVMGDPEASSSGNLQAQRHAFECL